MARHCAISLSGSTQTVHMLAQEFKVLGAILDLLCFCQVRGRLCPDSLSSWEVLNCKLSNGETQASEVSCQEEFIPALPQGPAHCLDNWAVPVKLKKKRFFYPELALAL